MKRFMCVIGAVLLLGLCTSCTKNDGGAQKDKDVTIKFVSYTAGAENKDTLKTLIDIFEEENPGIHVDYEIIGYNDYFIKLKVQAASNTLPDVFEINYENFISFADKNVLKDFSDRESNIKLLGDALNNFKYNQKLYGLTEQASTVLTFYNKDLFDAKGISYPSKDWTWNDEVTAAKKLKTDTVYGSYFPLTFNEMYKIIAQNGGSFFDKKGNPTIDTKENVEALTYMVERVLLDKVQPTPAFMSGKSPEDMFKNGELAILHTGIWMFEYFKSNDFSWDVAQEPYNTTHANHMFADGLVASKNTKYSDAAWKFITFMSTSQKVAQIKIENNMGLPVIDNNDVEEMYLAKTIPANRKAVFESFEYGIMPPATVNISKLADLIDREIANVLMEKKTVKEALSDAQKEAVNQKI